MANALRLFGLRAIVTGAASGVGEAIVRTLIKHGAEVLAVDSANSGIETHFNSVRGVQGAVVDGVMQLQREFGFDNFEQAMAFSNRVGDIAEAEGHHPAILTEWGKVTVTWWSHKIRGLHNNDLIMAARTDEVYGG